MEKIKKKTEWKIKQQKKRGENKNMKKEYEIKNH